MTELGELKTVLRDKFDVGLRFLLGRYLSRPAESVLGLVYDQAARWAVVERSAEAQFPDLVHRALSEAIGGEDPLPLRAGTSSRLTSLSTKRFLARLNDDLDREVILRFFLAGEHKESICRALELSDYLFNQILTRTKSQYSGGPSSPNEADGHIVPRESGDLLDRYLLGHLAPEMQREVELRILDNPALIAELEVTIDLITDLRTARLPHRYRKLAKQANPATAARLARRRQSKGFWEFITRPCFGIGASLVILSLICGSVYMLVAEHENVIRMAREGSVFQPTELVLGQTRGSAPSTSLNLSPGDQLMIVHLDLGLAETDRYHVSLADHQGDQIWSKKRVPVRSDKLQLTIDITGFQDGLYRFTAQPSDGLGAPVRYAFQVNRRDQQGSGILH